MSLEFASPAVPISPTDVLIAAQRVGLSYALVEAVQQVESSGGGFLPDSRPKILCEAQQFHNRTGGKFDATHPHVSSPVWNRALYAPTGEGEYARLHEMISLDRDAALQSASWGAFQILGSNFKSAGYPTVEAFVAGMCLTEAAHLAAFLAFIQNERLLAPLKALQWAAFARGYNGPKYAVNAYDTKLRDAYTKALLANQPQPSSTQTVDARPPS